LLFVALFLFAQASNAATYPLNITPGRSWPLSIIADSSRGLVYFDTTSGEYPPTGFSFGIINTTTHAVTKILPLDVNPGAMTLNQKSGDVYVAGSTSIAVFDAGNLSFVRQIAIGRPILSMAYDSSVSQNLFVTSRNSVFSVNPRTGALERNATFANYVDGIALDPANGRLFVGEYPEGEISVLNASSLAPLGTIALPGCCALQFSLDVATQVMYAATGTNFMYAVNAATDTFDKSVQVAPSAQNSTNSIVVDNNTGRVYVATSPGGSIIELDSAGNVVGHYVVQSQSQVSGMTLDTKTEELYATNYHQITVFDAARPRTFFFLIVVTGAVVTVAAIGIYLFVRRRDNKGRMQIQLGRQTEGRPP
jgi:DNA-binding beta-propeller fold protein YncE